MEHYIVSARKYRPSTFHSVVGQKSLTTTLKNAVLNHKLAHAYLFCGPRGVGKTTCARIFAKTINCFYPTSDGEACNECESCTTFNENRSLNIHELDAASNNSVDDIRTLTEQVRIPPQLGKYKVYIIDEVHMLSSAAFNAFLKTLEEPPRHAIFILATTEKHKILPTILSRCQIYDFSRIGINDIVEYLEYVSSQENVHAEKEALNVIAQKADGGMRDALSIFDQVVSFSQGNVTYRTVIENLNVLDYEYYFRLTDRLLDRDVSGSLLLLNEILKRGFDGQQILTGLAVFYRDLLICKDPQTIVLFELGDAVRNLYLQFAARCDVTFLYKAIELTSEADQGYRFSRNKRLSIELLLIRMAQLKRSSDSAEDAAEAKKKITIEPIVVSDSSHQPPIQQPQPPSRSGRQDVVSGETAYTTPPRLSQEGSGGEGAIVSPSPAKSPLRVSIRKTPEQEVEKSAQKGDASPATLRETPFSQEVLSSAWKEFAEAQADPHFKSMALYAPVRLDEGFRIAIGVLNPEQESKFRQEMPAIKNFLSDRLQNDRIVPDIFIKEEDKRDSLFTDKERYQYLLSKNSTLDDLVREFNLRLD